MDLSTVELDSNPGPASYMLWDFAQSSCSVASTLLFLTLILLFSSVPSISIVSSVI